MQVLPTLHGAQVMELLEGSDPAPAKTMEVEGSAVANPAYSAWLARDQQVVSFLTKSMNKDFLSHMFGLQHASEIWEAIEALFASESKAKVAMLRAALINTKKRDMSASQFISKMKGFASELAATGRIIDDEELKEYILGGLDAQEYTSLVTSVNANPSTTLQDLCAQLSAYDYRQQMMAESGQGSNSFSSSANTATRGRPFYNNRGYSRNRGRQSGRQNGPQHRSNYQYRGGNRGGCGRGRGRTPSPQQDVTCQICKKYGHPANECWWRYSNNDDDSMSGDKNAHIASYGVDTNWYTDTGATDHITGELQKLTTQEKYTDRKSVV